MMRAPARRRFLLRGGLAVMLAAAAVRPVSGQDGGTDRELRIDGRVLHAVDSTGLAGVDIELHRVTQDSGQIAETTQSGVDGSFLFQRDEQDGSNAVFIVSARYDGIRYFGPPMHAGADESEDYEIYVYDTLVVSTPPALEVNVRHLLFTADAGEPDLIDVVEVIDIAGRPDRTIVPESDGLAVWRGRLPSGARGGTVVPGGLRADQVMIVGENVEVGAYVPPGGIRLTIRYRLPEGRIRIPIDHPTKNFQLLVAGEEIEASVDGITGGEAVDMAGFPYRRFSGSALAPGTRVAAHLMRRTRKRVGAWLWLATATLLLGAAVAIWRRQAVRER